MAFGGGNCVCLDVSKPDQSPPRATRFFLKAPHLTARKRDFWAEVNHLIEAHCEQLVPRE
jgi:hypothetical protein